VLGLEKGEDIDEFVSALKVEGVDMKVIEEYLKKSKEGLKMENKKEKKLKKKK
jgi:lipoate synthase